MANTRAVKHRGPAQIRVLDKDVILLRKVNFRQLSPPVMDKLRNTQLRPGEPEGDMPWFMDGYIAAEQPRSYQMSSALVKASQGFALARTDTGEILAEFDRDNYARAFRIAEKSTREVAINVLLDEAKEDEDDEDVAVEHKVQSSVASTSGRS